MKEVIDRLTKIANECLDLVTRAELLSLIEELKENELK